MECGEGTQWPPQLPGYDLGKLTHGGNDGRGPYLHLLLKFQNIIWIQVTVVLESTRYYYSNINKKHIY